jgi:hypothetical protein
VIAIERFFSISAPFDRSAQMKRVAVFNGTHMITYVVVGGRFFLGVGAGQRPLVPLLLLASIFPIILFLSTTLLTGMTGITMHIQ